jgi:hypothetical protein
MGPKNIFLRRCALGALLVPLFGAGLVHCTLDGLNALGAGSPEAGLPSGSDDAGSSSKPPVVDSSAPLDTGTAPPSPPVDSGSTPPVDSGTPPIVDAGTDAGLDSSSGPPAAALPIFLDASTPSWCNQHLGYAFCADFDESPLPAGFSASDGPYLAQTSSSSSSSPNDLLLYVPTQTSASTWGSKLSRQFETVATSIVLAFDIDPESLNTSSNGMLFAGLDFLGNANAKYSLRLAYNAGAPRLEESYLGSPADIYHSNFTIPLHQWSRVQVEITFPAPTSGDGGGGADAGTATETIYVNSVLQGITETLTPPAGFDQRPNLLVGAVFGTSPSNTWVIRYDNVTFDIQ